MFAREVAARFFRLVARVTAAGAIALACLVAVPAPALADSVTCGSLVLAADAEGKTLAEGIDYTYADSVLTIRTTDFVTVSMEGGETSIADRIVVDPGAEQTAHVTLDGVEIDVSKTKGAAAMLVSSGSLELTLAGESSLKSGESCAGLQNGESPLVISGGGSLSAAGGRDGAGIGGGLYGTGSNITIKDGVIAATGGENGAGIGGGYGSPGSSIRIEGGKVSATGGQYGAGIGAGSRSISAAASNITIVDGTVTAKGGEFSAGIGGGDGGSASNISISGGLLDVTSGENAQIIGGGRGYYATSSNIFITGGCFAPNAAEDTEAGTIYGITLNPPYQVIRNDDPALSARYPHKVERSSDLVISAVEEGKTPVYGEDGDYYYSTDGTVYITGELPMVVSMEKELVHPAGEGSTATTSRIVVDPGAGKAAHVTLDSVEIDVSGTVGVAAMLASSGSLELTLEGENSLKSGRRYAGLQSDVSSLTIKGDGSLSAFGGDYGAGIGGGYYQHDGKGIMIEGGKISATGGRYGAGIGGGWHGGGSNLLVSGGTVNATGGDASAGIGGGTQGGGSNIAISGGIVTATGGEYGAGIGSGIYYGASDIFISGGLINAKSGGGTAQAIGNGDMVSSTPNISITGGCFADSAKDFASASDSVDRGTVYGIAVLETSETEGVDGYAVIDNPDEKTAGQYPVTVVAAKLQKDASLAVDEDADLTYDGAPIESDVFMVAGGAEGVDPAFFHRAADASDTDVWENGLPVNAGSWLVRATVALPYESGYNTDDKVFYFEANNITNEVEVAIDKAQLTVEADNQTVVFNGALPKLTYTVSGFKGSDDASVIAGKPTLTCPSYKRGVTTAGSYADAIQVDVSGMSAENYIFVAQNGTLTVSAPSDSGIKPEQAPGSGSQFGDGAADPEAKTLASTGDVSLAVMAATAVIGAACVGVGAIRRRK